MSWFGVRLLEMLAIAVEESVIFANSLVGATMQDGGKRERSDVKFKIIKIEIKTKIKIE